MPFPLIIFLATETYSRSSDPVIPLVWVVKKPTQTIPAKRRRRRMNHLGDILENIDLLLSSWVVSARGSTEETFLSSIPISSPYKIVPYHSFLNKNKKS